ncbi:hypothetical protein [Paenibacillus sp. yr247]|uniref:hypothetical protein n=1 Tax=Paenibacillus sp. yr247 TaxID=1761880 RepID=UPI001C312804|nr:hypothetical protein [Paenibacillus sp. yr247]
MEHYVKENCNQEIRVTGFQFGRYWAQQSWTAITSDPKINNLHGAILDNQVIFFKPESLKCKGGDSYRLNRSDRRFYPIDVTNGPPSPSNVPFNIWMCLLFGGMVGWTLIYLYDQKMKQH